MLRSRAAERGQVLIMFAIGLVVLLGVAALAIDIGRLMAERRHLQTAADAGALAACQSLIDGAVADVAAAEAKARNVASVNIEGSPSGTTGTMAATPVYDDEDGDGFLGPDELTSGVVVSSSSARVAISSTIETTLARVVGIQTLDVGARAHCTLEHDPAIPIVARRYNAPPGPGGGFVDVLASEGTSTDGTVDPDPLGYDERAYATDVPGGKGPLFDIYGIGSKALNSSEFRGFINLDIRDFRDESDRDYYNGAEPNENENTMKAEQAEYLLTGYPGPGFPAATTPPSGDLQVATLSGHSTGHLLTAFDDAYSPGDRVMLAVYDGTVRAIPDFSITPPSGITVPATTGATPVDGPTFSVSRNDEFNGAVNLQLLGDAAAPDPTDNILPTPGTAAPAVGAMNEPVFDPDNFTFAVGDSSIDVAMEEISTNTIAPGIYTVWVKGTSSVPVKSRQLPVPVSVGGATRGFSLSNSLLSGSTPTVAGSVALTVRVKSESWTTGAPATPVALSWDTGSLTDCLLNPVATSGMTAAFSPSSVVPASGQGAPSTLTVGTGALSPGCYMFTVRAHATNRDGQPVTRLASATFYVAAEPSDGSYVEINGFAMFEVATVDSNAITGRAISRICADPNCDALRQVQRARLIPWS